MEKKYYYLIGIMIVLFALSMIRFPTLKPLVNEDNRVPNHQDQNIPVYFDNLRSAGYYTSESVILIDGDATGVGAKNWTWAVAQDWCSGTGTEEDPYLIENLTITVNSTSAGLTIQDSTLKYFTVHNVTITNVNNGAVAYGLKLSDIANGTVSSCNFSLSRSGIYMENTNSTVISSTYCSNNDVDGLYAIDCKLDNITIDASENGDTGMVLVDSDNFLITESQFFDNIQVGLTITEDDGDSINNDIYDNIFSGNDINAVDNCSLALSNTWDNGATLGNDWDDYIGEDLDDDGIGTPPYDISGTNGAVDNYPIFWDGVDGDHQHRSKGEAEIETFWGYTEEDITLFVIIGLCFVAILSYAIFMSRKR